MSIHRGDQLISRLFDRFQVFGSYGIGDTNQCEIMNVATTIDLLGAAPEWLCMGTTKKPIQRGFGGAFLNLAKRGKLLFPLAGRFVPSDAIRAFHQTECFLRCPESVFRTFGHLGQFVDRSEPIHWRQQDLWRR